MTESRPRVLLLTPATRWGSWIWLQRVIAEASGDARWTVVSYGRPPEAPVGVRFVCLPAVDYVRIGNLLSRRHFLPLNFLFFFPLAVIAWWLTLRERHDVLVGNGVFSTALLLLARRRGTRLALAFHAHVGHLSGIWAQLVRWLLPKCDMIFVNSETSRQDLLTFTDSKQIVLVPHWAEQRFFDLSIERGSNTPLRVLYVGRMDEEKFAQCLRVCRPLAEQGIIEFWTLGSGPLSKDLLNRRGCRSIGYIEDRDAVARVYGQADVVWAPADSTYLSIPGAESLAAGNPLIVSDVPAVEMRAAAGVRIPRDLVPPYIGKVVDGIDDSEAINYLRRLAKDGIATEQRTTCRAYAMSHHHPSNATLVTSQLLPATDCARSVRSLES